MDLPGRYTCTELCELVRILRAEVLAVYGSDFYKGMPVLTRNRFGKGWAYYLLRPMSTMSFIMISLTRSRAPSAVSGKLSSRQVFR